MPRRNRRKNSLNLTPAIVLLNVTIAIVLVLLIYAIYAFIVSEETDKKSITIPPETEAPTAEMTFELTTVATTTTPPPITKASTTTPVVSSVEDQSETEPITISSYSAGFFDGDMFVGDSIMTGFSGFGYLPKKIVFAKTGLNPESVLTSTVDEQTVFQKATELAPRNIYIMLGTNGLAYMSGSYMADNISALCERLEADCPNSQLYLLTIPPVTKEHDEKGNETMALVTAYNDALKNVAADMDIPLIDICTLLTNEDGYMADLYAELDGLHFQANAYRQVLAYIEECVSQ